MSRSQITFTLGQGTIANPATGTDYISGLQFYSAAPFPGSFGTTACQPVFSLSDAESKGIINNYYDETQSKSTITWILTSTTLVAGNTITITVNEPNPNSTSTPVVLCTYTVVAADITDTTGATLNNHITAAINATSYLSAIDGVNGYTSYTAGNGVIGYSATAATNVTTVWARVGVGVSLANVKPTVTLSNGTFTAPVLPSLGLAFFTGGVYSQKAIWHYHISEFFRANPTSQLWVQFSTAPSTTFSELTALQTAASGSCMRIGVYSFVPRTASQVASDLQAMQVVADGLFAAYQPAAIFYAPNIAAISGGVSALSNLQSAVSAKSCYCIISQDGAGDGAQLFVNSYNATATTGTSVTNIGCILGTSSKASVSQDIGEIGAFNLSNGTEMNVPAFSTGTLVSSVASSLLDLLDGYRYGFCVNMTGYPGTFVNNDWTAIQSTNAYNRLGRVLTIYKVERQQYIALLPLLKSRIYLNADGTMTQSTLEQYIGAAEPRIMQMVNDGDLSPGNITGGGLTKGVVSIDPTQNVNSQGYISIVYNLLGVDIADSINVTLQFTQKLA